MQNRKRRRGGRRRKPTAQELPESTGRTGAPKPEDRSTPPPLQPAYPGLDDLEPDDGESAPLAEFNRSEVPAAPRRSAGRNRGRVGVNTEPNRPNTEDGDLDDAAPRTEGQQSAAPGARRSRRGSRGRRGRKPARSVQPSATGAAPAAPAIAGESASFPARPARELDAPAAPDFAPELQPAAASPSP